MKFPSLNHLVQTAANVVKRFPFEILSALVGTIAATVNVELKYIDRESENIFIRLIMAAELSLLISFAATLLAESNKLKKSEKLVLRLAGLFLALILFFLIHPGERNYDYIRFFLLVLAFHLAVAFAAFTGKNHVNAFWQFNKTLFLRFLTAILYSVVLFLGIAAAISAVNFLFNFKFEWDMYSILWLWIAGVFNTSFFLAGVPADLAALQEDHSYPKGLKLFTQYVLIPLASIYVLILLAYEIKILLAWNLPKGLVSNLILSYAVFGILSLLLVYPIRNQDENKWLKTYSRYFYFLLIPLLLLLFVAAGTRVFRYGVTVNRYFLILLAFWLFFVTIYFLVSKKQNIKLIPISLCLITLLSIYGPQSAFSVSERSQKQILVNIFKNNHSFVEGKLRRLPANLSLKDGNRAAATLQFLIRNYDFAAVQPLFNVDLEKISDSLSKQIDPNNHFKLSNGELKDKKINWAKENLGLKTFSGYSYDSEIAVAPVTSQTFYISPENQQLTLIKGYDYLINATNQDSLRFTADGLHFAVNRNYDLHFYAIRVDNAKFNFKGIDLLDRLLNPNFHLSRYLKDSTKANADHYYVSADSLSITKTLDHVTVKFQVSYLSYTKDSKGKIELQMIQGDYLIKKVSKTYSQSQK